MGLATRVRNSHSCGASSEADFCLSEWKQTFFLSHRNIRAPDRTVPARSPGRADQAIPVGPQVAPYCVTAAFIFPALYSFFNVVMSHTRSPAYVSFPLLFLNPWKLASKGASTCPPGKSERVFSSSGATAEFPGVRGRLGASDQVQRCRGVGVPLSCAVAPGMCCCSCCLQVPSNISLQFQLRLISAADATFSVTVWGIM